MNLREKMNGSAKPVSIGAVTGIAVAVIAFVGLHLTFTDRLRAEGAHEAAQEQRIVATERWVADYERNVRPLREEFLRLTGELKVLPGRLDNLQMQIERLNYRLDRLDRAGVGRP